MLTCQATVGKRPGNSYQMHLMHGLFGFSTSHICLMILWRCAPNLSCPHSILTGQRLATAPLLTRIERAKFASDNCVLIKSDGNFWAEYDHAALSHSPPGCEECAPDEEADLAQVVWLAESVPTWGITATVSDELQCSFCRRACKMFPQALFGQ